MSFAGKVVLITGASSGIGADAAVHFAGLGASVSMTGRDNGKLQTVAQQIRTAGGAEPLTIAADVTTDAERIVSETISRFGRLDVLINNAGICTEDTSMEAYDRVLNTNLRAVFALTGFAVPHLEQTKGNIVNVSSVAGIRAFAHLPAYCASKGALDQFTKCTALELAPKGVRVNSINPAAIKTPIFENMLGLRGDELEKKFDEMATAYPMQRIGEVSDTSAAMAFLASDSAGFITGVLLPLDGGLSLSCPR